MKIRLATRDDLVPVTELALEFYKQTKWNKVKPTTAVNLSKVLARIIELPNCDILLVERGENVVGVAGIWAEPLWMNPEIVSATELFWYVDKENRKTKAGALLFKHLEKWCEDKEVTLFNVACLDHMDRNRIHNVYTRKGFECTEHYYAKEL